MSFTIGFKTSKFDVSKEDENPINPIFCYVLLLERNLTGVVHQTNNNAIVQQVDSTYVSQVI